ncbi:MAG: PKD domain-containing protein [Actinobacteria bacterium]|nr:PKD domain-containing protein [Actinomycetota bacterium]
MRSWLALAVSFGVVSAGFWVNSAPVAEAALAPLIPRASGAITADRLPSVQIDGVVWSQAIVGNIVYAGGKFTNARPAGAAAGTNLTTRNNLLAYNITDGTLVTSFAPNLNGQVLGVAASPDGSRIYVVGDFTTANGTARRRVAAYSTATGALITAFNPVGVNSQARAVIATNDAVYVGGGFLGAGSTLRNNLAAFRATDGALLPWNPNADATVWAMAISQDGANVFAGGMFQNVGGQPQYGMTKVSAATGAVDSAWLTNTIVRNAGADAAVGSLRVQGDYLYGTTWHFGPGGNLEGTFKASVDTGEVSWVTDCHGDNYSEFVSNGVVYTVSHSHYCGNMGGGHPQYEQWKFLHATAWTDDAQGEILNDVWGYPNWHGKEPAPSMVNWFPDFAIGSYTGQYQAGWNVVGNSDYIAVGGEFPRVNGVAQQGIVRFGRAALAPKAEGPKFPTGSAAPTLAATSPTSVRVIWPTAYDRDDATLTYKVVRDGATGSPRFTKNAASTWWNLPSLGYEDTGLTPGATYRYQIVTNDADGNTVYGASTSITMPASVAALTSYANVVRAKGARIYWPLDETSSTVIRDRAAVNGVTGSGVNDGTGDTDVVPSNDGAIAGNGSMLVGSQVPDQPWGRIFENGTETGADTFTEQVWIKTTTTNGGRILGFGDLQKPNSGHRDRHLYMDNAGRISFGVRAQDGSNRTVTSGRAYNDGQWHMLSASMSSAGMVLYVDGVRVAKRSDVTAGEAYLGYWKVQGDNLDGWANRPNSNNFTGLVDEVAIYPTALSQTDVLDLYTASGRTATIPPAPADAYGAMIYNDDPDLFWRLADTTGTTAADSSRSLNDGTYVNGPTKGVTGVISGNTAATFDGNDDFVASNAQFSNPTVYSEEAWFKTTDTSGGKIIGFGSRNDGTSDSYDRHVYLQGDGRVVFGVWTGTTNTITSTNSYNDGAWHHVVATQSGNGMKLYLDGVLVGTNPQTAAQDYNGYWKVGGDNTWGSDPYLNGTIDEAAVYSYELTAAQVQNHYTAAGFAMNQAPSAAFTSTVLDRRATFDGSASTDPDGSVTGYSWDFGDGTTGSGVNPVHVYAGSGSYNVTLTATDNKGATGTVVHQVTITAGSGPLDNYGAAVYTDHPRIYWRFGEASGTVANDASGSHSTGTYRNGPTLGRNGALPIPNTAAGFDGSNDFVSSDDVFNNPTVFSTEAWFRTTTTVGGKIIGFGRNQTDNSSSYDRHVYMNNAGQLEFGVWTGQMNIITSPASYNDGSWHQVVAELSGNGMKLYVDGALVGTNPQTSAEDYPGYWKVGGDVTWNSSSWYFNGDIDEVAVYESELSAARVLAHYEAAQPAPNQNPVAAYTYTPTDLNVVFNGTGSNDPDGTITSFAWDFGDGSPSVTDTLQPTHLFPATGTYAVKLTVNDDRGGTNSITKQVSVLAPNVLPNASFTTTIDHLDLSVDAGGSTDPDGTIATYAWNFGDGATGTGLTAQHSYTTAGNYTVTLTVTDDRFGQATTTRQVVATDPPPNQAPTAAFTSTPNNLAVSFDGSGSSDADGTIAGYAWTFGDGDTATTQKPNHTYGAAGTYTVKLVVTDDDGATGEVTHTVTVTAAPTTIARDTFTRTQTGGWGTANTGGNWTVTGASNLAVNGSAGTMRMTAGGGPSAYLNSVSARDVDLTVQVGYDKAGTGGGIYTSLIGRRIGTSDYRVKLRVTATVTTLYLARTVSGTETVLTTQNISGMVYAPGDVLNVRFQLQGANSTTLRAKVWKEGTTEPASWQTTTTDSTAALQAAGAVGLYSYLSSSATNAPVTATIDNFVVTPLP